MNIKSSRFKLEKADDEQLTFSGYASVFGNKDSYGDIVEKGAFTKTIGENKSRIKVLWQHNVYEPIGIPISISENEKGLFTETKISKTDFGMKAYQLIKDGVITEMSIGYDPIKEEYNKDTKINSIKELKLWEYSVVTFGANDLAQITGKSDILHMSNYYGIDEKTLADIIINSLKGLIEPLKDTQESKESNKEIKSFEDTLLTQLKQYNERKN